jgi:hypothetical protein
MKNNRKKLKITKKHQDFCGEVRRQNIEYNKNPKKN